MKKGTEYDKLIQENEQLKHDCNAYKWAWERCVKQIHEMEIKKHTFCEYIIQKKIENLDVFSDTLANDIKMLQYLNNYWEE